MSQFTVVLNRVAERWRWVVTCEKCGVDLSSDYSAATVTLLKVRGFDEVVANDPSIAHEFAARMRRMWDDAARTRRPMIVDADNVSTEQVPSLELQRVLEEHAATCG